MARIIEGYKWEFNYRGWDVYYSATAHKTIAFHNTLPFFEVPGADGSITRAIDEFLEKNVEDRPDRLYQNDFEATL